ncbi:hypothetical protein SNEBB_010852 [Seison nebaliae]|nr:hypothetical protein SNEBB_010852 [Seison nebaliae]
MFNEYQELKTINDRIRKNLLEQSVIKSNLDALIKCRRSAETELENLRSETTFLSSTYSFFQSYNFRPMEDLDSTLFIKEWIYSKLLVYIDVKKKDSLIQTNLLEELNRQLKDLYNEEEFLLQTV